MNNLLRELYDENVGIKRIHLIQEPESFLEEFLDELNLDDGVLSESLGLELDGESLQEHLIENMEGHVLAIISTPVMRYVKNSKSACSFSWGHYYSECVIGKTLDEIYEKALVWAKEMHEKDKKEGVKDE